MNDFERRARRLTSMTQWDELRVSGGREKGRAGVVLLRYIFGEVDSSRRRDVHVRGGL